MNLSDKLRHEEPLYKETEHKLFVGNLSEDVTSEDLRKTFEKYGEVVSAQVLIDGDTGGSCSYGFVCYATSEEMEVAMEALDGEEIDGRLVRVARNAAVEKP